MYSTLHSTRRECLRICAGANIANRLTAFGLFLTFTDFADLSRFQSRGVGSVPDGEFLNKNSLRCEGISVAGDAGRLMICASRISAMFKAGTVTWHRTETVSKVSQSQKKSEGS